MTELRITRSANDRRLARRAGHGWSFVLGFGALLVGILGCGHDPQATTANPATSDAAPISDRPLMTQLAAPRSEWIDYSPKDRKLTLYDLPASGRWMVRRSDNPIPYPIGPEHILPEGVDPKETVVFYVRPGGQRSRTVTLAQIQASRPDYLSLR